MTRMSEIGSTTEQGALMSDGQGGDGSGRTAFAPPNRRNKYAKTRRAPRPPPLPAPPCPLVVSLLNMH